MQDHSLPSNHRAWVRVRLLTCSIFFICLFSCVVDQCFAQKVISLDAGQEMLPVTEHMSYMLDPIGQLRMSDVEVMGSYFQPLNTLQMSKRTGVVWLKFTMGAREVGDVDDASQTLLLDLGYAIPSAVSLFAPQRNILNNNVAWQEHKPSQYSVFLLPEAQIEPTTLYIRMDGVPGLWFSPIIRTPHNVATAFERMARPALIVVLGLVFLICLLRWLLDRNQWRIWAALCAGAALANAWWGIPILSVGTVSMGHMGMLVIPGLALMLLPHVGRHLMRTHLYSRSLDIQYVLLALPGIAVALVPLIPGYTWTMRYLVFWPALTLLCVPTTIGAWLSGLPGARRFLLGCLLPPLGAVVALVGLVEPQFFPEFFTLFSTLPLFGLAIGIFLMAGTSAPREYSVETSATVPVPRQCAHHVSKEEIYYLLKDDPNLALVLPEGEQEESQGTECVTMAGHMSLVESAGVSENIKPHMDTASTKLLEEPQEKEGNINSFAYDKTDNGTEDKTVLCHEDILQQSVDRLVQEVTFLQKGQDSSSAQQRVSTIRHMVQNIDTILTYLQKDTSEQMPIVQDEEPFNLHTVLRQAHDAVSALACEKNIGLSWFMPPHLGQRYIGKGTQLFLVLRLLLESAVQAIHCGSVQLAVRRVPESTHEGHLLFTVTDMGTSDIGQGRSALALAQAWELAVSNDGFLSVETGQHGATVSFTIHCKAVQRNVSADETPVDDAHASKVAEAVACSMSGAAAVSPPIVQDEKTLDTESALLEQGSHDACLSVPLINPVPEHFATNVVKTPTLSFTPLETFSATPTPQNTGISNEALLQQNSVSLGDTLLRDGVLLSPLDTEQQPVTENIQSVAENIQTDTHLVPSQALIFAPSPCSEKDKKNSNDVLHEEQRDEFNNFFQYLDAGRETAQSQDNVVQVRHSSRPAPAADKSNAAYITSLVDDGMLLHKTPTASQAVSSVHSEAVAQNKIESTVDTAANNGMEAMDIDDSTLFAQLASMGKFNPGDWVGEPTPIRPRVQQAFEELAVAPLPRETVFVQQKTSVQDAPVQEKVEQGKIEQEMPTVDRFAVSQQETAEKNLEESVSVAKSVAPVVTDDVGNRVLGSSSVRVLTDTVVGEPFAMPRNELSIERESVANVVEDIVEEKEELTPLEYFAQDLRVWIVEARQCFNNQDTAGVARVAGYISVNAEGFGRRSLGRMAHRVAVAAQVQDWDTLRDFFPDLELGVERTVIELGQ